MNLLPRDEINRLFKSFEHTAFRLEVRARYNEPSEAESLRRFLAGEPDERRWKRGWLDMIRELAAEGKRIERVRVVGSPITDYNRFGYAGSEFNNEAGEDIRYLARDRADGLPNHDYWLFDSRTLARMHFDEDDDHWLGVEIIDDPAEIVQHNYWRDLAWHRAVRREEFAIE